jgi:hypothetical protein
MDYKNLPWKLHRKSTRNSWKSAHGGSASDDSRKIESPPVSLAHRQWSMEPIGRSAKNRASSSSLRSPLCFHLSLSLSLSVSLNLCLSLVELSFSLSLSLPISLSISLYISSLTLSMYSGEKTTKEEKRKRKK